MTFSRAIVVVSGLLSVLCVGCGQGDGTETKKSPSAPKNTASDPTVPDFNVAPTSMPAAKLEDRVGKAIDRGIKYLRANQDVETGGVAYIPGNLKTRHPGVTAMAITAFAQSPRKYREEDGPFMRNALNWIASLQKPDGSIYEQDNANYCTSLAVLMFTATGDPKWKPLIDKAVEFIVRTQCNDTNGYKPTDKFFGGVGYGTDERPDLSNTHFGLEAAHAANLPADHPFFKNAVTFLARNQNLGESNDQVWKLDDGTEIRPGNDGGAIYAPGESKSGIKTLPDGRKVYSSYGSMSYALLKGYIFCGLDRRDPRVKAVAKWCADNFQIDYHPGFEPGPRGDGQFQGLFYYYMALARTMKVLGDVKVTDGAGVEHDWRRTLLEKLLSLQQSDGSFINSKNGRWDESSAVICTAYALLAMQDALGSLAKK